jgi:hypothetical protein
VDQAERAGDHDAELLLEVRDDAHGCWVLAQSAVDVDVDDVVAEPVRVARAEGLVVAPEAVAIGLCL